MKMNLDCMRDVLEYLQDMPLNAYKNVNELCSELTAYEHDDVQYTCLKLYEAGMISAVTVDIDNIPLPNVEYIYDVTFQGHQFWSKIKDESRWKGIKKVLPTIRDYSIDAINAVANGFASAAISAFFSGNQPTNG